MIIFSCVWLLLAVRQSHTQFATDFSCNEIKQSTEYVDDVKIFVREMAEHFNRRETPNLDLSTIGMGFVDDESFLSQTYQHFLSLNLSMNVLKKNCLTSLDRQDRSSFLDLQSLNVSSNLIASIHPFTFSNLSLEFVDLSHNRLIRFWAADYGINQLRLHDNKIYHVEISSENYNEMKLLDARNNRIQIFQTNIDFENLILKNNRLKLDENFSIRNVFGTLDISRNLISEFSWKIINCVTDLNLAFNRLSTLPLDCPSQRFKRLERMNLNGNFLCNFYQSTNITACLPNLKFISLLENQLSGTGKIKTKGVLSSQGIRSQIFDYEHFSQLDDEFEEFDIFRN